MKIAVIGAGNIGGVLGRKWAAAGHSVRFGVRNPADARYDPLHTSGVVGSVEEAISLGDVVVLAVPGAGVAEFAAAHGAALAGKTVIDATNNVRGAEMNSLAVLAAKAPGAQLGRAFSTIGWENYAEPHIGGETIDLFFCSQPAVRATLEVLIAAVGLHPIYIGGVEMAGLLDNMTRIWFALASGQNYGRRIAFKLLVEGR